MKVVDHNTYRDPFALMAINGSSSSQSVANPKSDNLAVRELSSIILLGFMFPWTILNLFSSCKYFKPLAIPRQISNLALQSSFVVEFGSTNQDLNIQLEALTNIKWRNSITPVRVLVLNNYMNFTRQCIRWKLR